MRYAKLKTPDGPLYVEVEDRAGELWAVSPAAAPEEDPLPSLRPAVTFRPAPLAGFELLAPGKPSKIVCVGRNYRDHAAELGNAVPKEPMLFFKPPSSLLAPGGTILLPALSSRVDFEGELALVIGRRCRNLGPEEDVLPYLRGYTLVNDISARDLQKSDGQWTRAKGFDTFCPVGPVVTVCGEHEIDPVSGAPVTLTTRVNGETRQSGSTADLIFPIATILRYVTSFLTLEPGDLIPTGTPAGVGPLQPGDIVEVEIGGIGLLRNSVAAG
jgi:2-keto-4-pentenoate hydratase/2-oxohepta-3-ene-1,7-dioic acid hydratase in catechol pathway